MTRRLPLVVWLTLVWVGLWGEASAANLLGGVAVATLLVAAFHLPGTTTAGAGARVRPLRALVFLVSFAWKLVEASAVVAWEVLTPRKHINEGVIAVPLRSDDDLVVTIVANTVTLTPGTLSVELSPAPSVLYVHVLHLRSIESTRDDVERIERLVVRAFGNAAAVRALDEAERARDGTSEGLP